MLSSSTYRELRDNSIQKNNVSYYDHDNLQQTPAEYKPLYTDNKNKRRTIKNTEDSQRKASNNDNNSSCLSQRIDTPSQYSSVKREASIVYYCRSCGHTVNDEESANKPCANCDGELVLSTL
jgi:rubrerythrin